MNKHTKIIATVGPSSQDTETLERMIRAGVDLFRLNFSHGDHAYHAQSLTNIKEAARRTGRHIGVLQDISGPKVRIGDLAGNIRLAEGDTIECVREELVGDFVAPGRLRVSLNYPEIIGKVEVGDPIYLYDGIIRAQVVEKGEGFFRAKVLTGGILSPRKGVNFPHTRLAIDILTPKDIDDIRWGVENGVDFMAISFVQSADDMLRARDIVREFGGAVSLIAKIEKFEALEQFDAILEASDGVMVARGDLGIEVPYYKVPEIQKSLIKQCNQAAKPVITATQMLLSMTRADRATRAEISDVANAVLDGSDALMLSEESAIGDYPVEAVETMSNTIKEAEGFYDYARIGKLPYRDEMDVIDESAVNLVQHMDLDAILSITTSGGSAGKISRYRSSKPIYAITHDETILRKLTLVWGVRPLFTIPAGNHLHGTIATAIAEGIRRNVLDPSGGYVLTAGDHAGKSGTTNTIKILRQTEMRYYQEEYERHHI